LVTLFNLTCWQRSRELKAYGNTAALITRSWFNSHLDASLDKSFPRTSKESSKTRLTTSCVQGSIHFSRSLAPTRASVNER